jgi:hypothetical protein
MDPALTAALMAFAFSGISAFIGYWWGFGNAERDNRRRILALRAHIHEQQAFSLELADALYRAKNPAALTKDEAATFQAIADHYRKDCA